MANPFDKYLTKEDHLQIATGRYLATQYPHLLWWHTPNEGKRSKFERYKLMLMGAKSGVSDVIIISPRIDRVSLVLELKIKPNKCTANQERFLKIICMCGWKTEIAFNIDESMKIIDNYAAYVDYKNHFKLRV